MTKRLVPQPQAVKQKGDVLPESPVFTTAEVVTFPYWGKSDICKSYWIWKQILSS